MPHNREIRYATEAEAHAFADGIDLVNDSAITPLEIRALPDGGFAACLHDADHTDPEVDIIDRRDLNPDRR